MMHVDPARWPCQSMFENRTSHAVAHVLQAAVGAFMNVRTLFRGDLYTIAALDGHTREHLEVRISSAVSAQRTLTDEL